jgi:hypothetical protein
LRHDLPTLAHPADAGKSHHKSSPGEARGWDCQRGWTEMAVRRVTQPPEIGAPGDHGGSRPTRVEWYMRGASGAFRAGRTL